MTHSSWSIGTRAMAAVRSACGRKPILLRPLMISSYAGFLVPETPRRALRSRRRGKGNTMPYTMQPLACDPAKLTGLSEKLIVSHYENNYGGAVRRLNAITDQLASLDVATAPMFVLNGLKREELIATNSMILHELYFDSLGAEGAPDATLREALTRDFGSLERWQSEFVAMGKALGGG